MKSSEQFDNLKKETLQGQSAGLFQRQTRYANPHETIARLPKILPTTDLESILNNIELTLSHVIRDVMMVVDIQPLGDNPSLLERDYHRMIAGTAVYPAEEEKIYRLSTHMGRVILNYFLHEATYYCRVRIGHIELVVERSPQFDEAGNMYVELKMQDDRLERLPVISAVLVRGIGSVALQQELFALFRLRQQIFVGISNRASYADKVVVSVKGLTALMAEASKEQSVLEQVKHDLNQQVLGIFDQNHNIALVDANTRLGSLQLEMTQLNDQVEFLYTELARILQIPRSKLLGESPSGLNATGEYDYRNYQDLLEGIRTNVVYPFCEYLQVHYQVSQVRNLSDTKLAIETLMLAENNLNAITLDGWQAMYRNLLGSAGVGLLEDSQINIVDPANYPLREDSADA